MKYWETNNRASRRLFTQLDQIDRNEAFDAWVDAGQPFYNGTVLDWYRRTTEC